MVFKLKFTPIAREVLKLVCTDLGLQKRAKAINKTLALLETNPRHPSLNTHKYASLNGPRGEEVFEAYVENKTPAAYRIFWHYGPEKSHITIIAITPHP